MTDIDFDELDKAVNSAMSNPPTSDNVAINSQPTVNQNVAVSAQPGVANPRTGRFMDVVPPNANTRVNISVPSRVVSREGNDLDPNNVIEKVDATAAASSVVLADEVNPTQNQTTASNSSSELSSDSAAPITNTENEDADIDQISDDISKTMVDTNNQPIDTPFLADAKVDKRPLGAFSEQASSPEPQTVSTPETPVVEQPVSDSVEVEKVESSSQQPVVTEPQTQDNVQQVSSMSIQPEITSPVSTETRDSQTVGVASINQQYKEQPSSGDQTNGSIYDTDAYHKAVLKPVKKKSGWLMVLWIFLLLVVGAGSGAAVYFFVLPNL